MESRFNIIKYLKGEYGYNHDFNPIPIIIFILLLATYILIKGIVDNKDKEDRGEYNEKL